MKSQKNLSSLHIAIEAAAIVLVAAFAALLWNWQTLRDLRQHKVEPPSAAATAPAEALLPVPAPLPMVKDLHDKGALFIDARDAETYRERHIRKAISLPLGEADAGIATLKLKTKSDTALVVYCNGFGCTDSFELGKKLRGAGFTQVFVFDGGMPEWQDAGFPVEGAAQ